MQMNKKMLVGIMSAIGTVWIFGIEGKGVRLMVKVGML